MVINMTFTGKPLKSSLTNVKNLLDKLLLHPDTSFVTKFALKILLDCESTNLMKSWIKTNTDDDPDTIFDLVTAIIKHFGLDSIICSMSETNVITVMDTLPEPRSDHTDTIVTDDIADSLPAVPVTETDSAFASMEKAFLSPLDREMIASVNASASDAKDDDAMDDNNFIDEKPNDEFSTVKNGIKYQTQDRNSSPVKCGNSFENLRFDDDDDDDDDNKGDEHLSYSATSHTSQKLSFNSQSFQSSKENMKDFSILKSDQVTGDTTKFRFAKGGFVTMDGMIFNGHADTIGLSDLTWWVTQSTKRNANSHQNMSTSIIDRTRDIHLKLNQLFDDRIEEAEIDLALTSHKECEKIKSTSSHLTETIGHAENSIDQINEKHKMVSDLIISLETNRSEYVQCHELSPVQASVTRCSSLLQTIQTDQDTDRSEIRRLELLITSTTATQAIEISNLRQEIVDMKTSLLSQKVKGEQSSPPTSSPLFPHVTQTNGRIHHVNNPSPPLVVEEHCSDDRPLPISTIINAEYGSGTLMNCLVTKCLRQKTGFTYTVVSNDGSEHKIRSSRIISSKFTDVPNEKYPPNYITDDIFKTTETLPSRRSSPERRAPSHYNYNSDDDDERNEEDKQYAPRNENSRPQRLAHNAFEYPPGTYRIIREDKAKDISSSWSTALKHDVDPRGFYTDLRNNCAKYNVLLLQYTDITTSSGLLEITQSNSVNFETAKNISSRFLYDVFNHGRDTMFDDNLYALSLLTTFAHEQDGLGFLHNLIREHHKNLRKGVTKSNITQACQLPQLSKHENVVTYIEELKIYVQDVAQHLTQLEILQLVTDQLETDSRFTSVANHFKEKTSIFMQNDTRFLDSQYSLINIARTIMSFYKPEERNQLLKPRSNFNSLVTNAFDRKSNFDKNKLPFGKKPFQHRDKSRDKSPFKTANKTAKDDKQFCKGCRTYGHEVENCNKTGAQISITQFLDRLPVADAQRIKQAYIDNRKEAHKKYLESYASRRTLRNSISTFAIDLFPTEESMEEPSDAMTTAYEGIRDNLIMHAVRAPVDIDFGSLDPDYLDPNEPFLQFDPENEELE